MLRKYVHLKFSIHAISIVLYNLRESRKQISIKKGVISFKKFCLNWRLIDDSILIRKGNIKLCFRLFSKSDFQSTVIGGNEFLRKFVILNDGIFHIVKTNFYLSGKKKNLKFDYQWKT